MIITNTLYSKKFFYQVRALYLIATKCTINMEHSTEQMLCGFKPTVLKPYCTTENFAAVKDAERILCWQTFRTSPFFHNCALIAKKTIIPCMAKCSASTVWRLFTMRLQRGSLPKPSIIVLRERENSTHHSQQEMDNASSILLPLTILLMM